MNRKIIGIMLTMLAVLAIALSGCAGPVSLTDSAQTSTSPSVASVPGTGTLEIRVTDAPAKEVITRIDVTVKSIELQRVGSGNGQPENITEEEGTSGEDNDTNNGWTTIKFTEGDYPTFDLLTVKDHPETLSSIPLELGSYKIRLEVDSVMVTFAGQPPVRATVPSGKIKFSSAFQITNAGLTVLTFDFDAARSVNVTGNGKENSKVMFKPVIKLSVSHETKEPAQNKDLRITTNKLPDGTVNAAYDNVTLAAVGGTGGYSWKIISGSLPDNLTLKGDTGLISGIPSPAGQYEIEVQVTDSSSPAKTAVREFTLEIKPAAQ